VETFGADALRFTLARGASPGGDMSIGEDHARASRNFATKLFNATRFALMNGAAPAPLPGDEDLTEADRWILGELAKTISAVDEAFDAYEFSRACDALYRFIWDDFCDWYVELAKVQVANGVAHTPAVLAFVLDNVLRLLHPIMPFVTETLWQALTGGESIVIAEWPKPQGFTGSEFSRNRVLNIQELITQIRRFRSDQGLKDRQRIPARVSGIPSDDTEIDLAPVFALAWLTESDEGFSPTASVEVRLSPATVTIELDTSGTVDIAAERRRLEKDLAAAEKELTQTTEKLGNEAFVAKAPVAVVDKIKARRQLASEEVERISGRLAGLS
jgi:valyl-tRNA synthetase